MITSPPSPAGSTGCGVVHIVPTDTEIHVVLTGEVDVGMRAALDGVVVTVAASGLPVHVDCTRVTYCGAEGVHLLTRLRDVCGLRGVAISASPCVRDMLRMCGVEMRMRAWS